MTALAIKTQRNRHLRRRSMSGLSRGGSRPRLQYAERYLGARVTTLATTGTGKTFTVNAIAVEASSILTFTDVGVDADDFTIGGRTYTLEDTLTDVDGNVLNGVSAAATIINIVAAINLAARPTADEVLTVAAIPANDETVVVGTQTYTFKTTLTTSATADEVLIGASAELSIDNLVAAITLTGTPGTDYGSDTTLNADATAAKTTASTMTATAKLDGDAGNSVAIAETLADGGSLWAAAAVFLSGGIDTYADSMTVNAEVTAADGTGDTIDITAIVAGDEGNLIATDHTNMTNATFTGAFLAGGEDGDTLDMVAHAYETADGPFLASTDTTLPAGLTATQQYWANVIDANNITLHTSRNDAGLALNQVNITDAGTGTHTLTPDESIDSMVEILRAGTAFEVLRDATDIDALIG